MSNYGMIEIPAEQYLEFIQAEEKLEAVKELLNSMQDLIDHSAVLRRDFYDYAEGLREILDA